MSVIVKVDAAGPCRKEIRIEVPPAAVESEAARVLKDYRRKAVLPGFRKGKVPESLVRRHFGAEMRQEVLDRLIPRYFRQAASELQLEPLLPPRYGQIEFDGIETLCFTAEVEVRPEVELRNYRDLSLPELPTEPAPEELERNLQALRRAAAPFQEVQRPAQPGDRVQVEVRSQGAGLEGAPLRLVSLDLPAEPQEANELEKALIGRAPGSTMPWMQEKEGGEREELVLRVVKVEAPELPSLDDEFVRKHFRVQSLDELRRLLFEEKRAELAEARRRARERAAFEQLLERHQVEVSERMLEVESRQVLEDFARSLAERGVRLDDPKIPWGELQAQARSQAERNLKIRFILDAISEREKIDVSEEEFERYLAWEARKAKTSPHALRHRWYEQGVLAEVRQGLRRRKVVARLIEGVPSATG